MEQIFIKQGDIILIPFPFSDQTGKKVRPALVVSNNQFNENSSDAILCGITTNISKDLYTVIIDNKSLEDKNIKESCCVKVENLLKIDKALIIKNIDKVKKEFLDLVIKKINNLF